ncbi:hypothetical protein MTBSS4_180075 [Magnetospirillum sp. SS-4]|nr:hypothetical protein MTBSS4_180075 [Magnetospirillum sp. SS-4]
MQIQPRLGRQPRQGRRQDLACGLHGGAVAKAPRLVLRRGGMVGERALVFRSVRGGHRQRDMPGPGRRGVSAKRGVDPVQDAHCLHPGQPPPLRVAQPVGQVLGGQSLDVDQIEGPAFERLHAPDRLGFTAAAVAGAQDVFDQVEGDAADIAREAAPPVVFPQCRAVLGHQAQAEVLGDVVAILVLAQAAAHQPGQVGAEEALERAPAGIAVGGQQSGDPIGQQVGGLQHQIGGGGGAPVPVGQGRQAVVGQPLDQQREFAPAARLVEDLPAASVQQVGPSPDERLPRPGVAIAGGAQQVAIISVFRPLPVHYSVIGSVINTHHLIRMRNIC